MTSALVVSHILLWIVVLVLALIVLALVRQVGAIQARIAPVGALVPQAEPRVGEPAPRLTVRALSGQDVTVGGERSDGKATLIVWVAAQCPVCHELLPVLASVKRHEGSWLELLLASEGEPAQHAEFHRHAARHGMPYLLSTELGLAFQVPKVPYAVLIDARGIVRAKGIVNTREHVESLFEAMERNAATVQEYLARTTVAAPRTADAGG